MNRLFPLITALALLSSCSYEMGRLALYSQDDLPRLGGSYTAAPGMRKSCTYRSIPVLEGEAVLDKTLHEMQKNFGRNCYGLQDVVIEYHTLSDSVTVTATPIFRK